MAKWTLGILDSRGWRVDSVTMVCGQDWTGLYSCRMLRATMDCLNTMLRTESNYSRYPKSQKVLPLNKKSL